MFGHQDNHSSQQDGSDLPSGSPYTSPKDDSSDNTQTASHTAVVEPLATDTSAAPAAPPTPAPTDNQPWQHPGTPLDNQPEQLEDVISPAGGFPKKPTYPAIPGAADDANSSDDASSPLAHELIDIKQQALNELSPLIDELDQTPEEKFRTVMMMIQASDDQALVKAAYTAAHAITDEKARAQALLDIVNEVNYFTQPH